MILKVFLLFLFLTIIALFVVAIANIFLPAIKHQLLKNSDFVFSPIEKNYIYRVVDNNLPVSDKRAVVLSDPAKEKVLRLDYNGIHNCAIIAKFYGSLTENVNDCIGYGDCARACPQQAIEIHNGTAIVTEACCGCGSCVLSCPKNLIELFPKNQKSVQYKNNVEKTSIVEIPSKKDFKFWKTWYKILN